MGFKDPGDCMAFPAAAAAAGASRPEGPKNPGSHRSFRGGVDSWLLLEHTST